MLQEVPGGELVPIEKLFSKVVNAFATFSLLSTRGNHHFFVRLHPILDLIGALPQLL